ncbi:Bacteriophage abortive infection AbiH [Intestinibacter bartlettii DSM 16795]|uniref:AbiH family protein n=1 Tax=Intestinibacter bartlettii TaxID=261299 RepID=UPI00016311D4|nr:AbiH family protein [Intestinibacter bartlettii]EDQ95618.1 hypothetical protein CLOBAR_02323 [Intestinibacter bartlettii DSM 16795]UWO80602.1 bacteriophage abortive infection AbiH family protein [Intestinibacter bartlettii]SKA58636.1 Bacteriophage abortive infection AbiH [Intestinibacter bartlettii DSM 16795]
MNILVIGNGFDLAHNLPTSYKDFLGFITYINVFFNGDAQTINNYKYAENFKKLHPDIQDYILKISELNKNDKLIKEIIELSSDNFWIKYFEKCIQSNELRGDNWIDFESEITKVVKSLEYLKNYNEDNLKLTVGNRKYTDNQALYQISKEIIKKISDRLKSKGEINTILEYEDIMKSGHNYSNIENHFFCSSNSKKVISELNMELNKLIRCLEIYLDYVVKENIKINKQLDDINNINHINHLISFNYTSTFENFYSNNTECDYIHGKANKNNNFETNNMVLGIDEYLDSSDKDIELDFIQFKKYFQRIYKKTGCEYKKWLEKIKENNLIFNKSICSDKFSTNIYFYGHSLDITDKDILTELINLEKSQIIIFYLDDYDYMQKIVNLVKLVGQDYLCENVYGSDPKIIFKEINKENQIENLEKTSTSLILT